MPERIRSTRPSLPRRHRVVVAAVIGALALLPAVASAQGSTFAASVAGSLGGPLDAETGGDPGIDNFGWQLGFSWATGLRTNVGVRVSQTDFSGEQLGGLFDPELTYVTIAGEYRYTESFYESGFYIGLGAYQLDGTSGVDGVGSIDNTALGVVVGVTGDFPINERFSIIGELSGHFADLDYGSQFFAFAHFGAAFHF